MGARLRAVLTPQAVGLIVLLMAAVLFALGGWSGGETALEKRTAKTLAAMAGVDEVKVVIATRASPQKTSELGIRSGDQTEIPCGAVAVVQGADDPWMRAKLTQALCALLGLPASSVSVISGGE